jgi:hypothetical protein
VVTFTLQDHHLSVGLGPPLEQIEVALQQAESGQEDGEAGQPSLWLKPLAVSLAERGAGPFHVADVSARAQDGRLRVSAWYRAGGLALAPITLMDGRVDNPPAAQAFAQEVKRRKSEGGAASGLPRLLDYWWTWIAAAGMLLGLFQVWRRVRSQRPE